MTRLHASLITTLLLVACTNDSAPGATSDKAKAAAKANADADAKGHKASAELELGSDGKPLGRVSASEFIDLRGIINRTPEQVDALLGEPTDTGSDRVSCVRFVPKRVFFACEMEIRVYGHPQFESIRVEFEDGRAAIVALSGLPGDGDFDPIAAITAVGLELPNEPVHDNPPANMGASEEDLVDRWEWGNSRARLLIDGLEHRVRLSVVNGDWRRAKLELINNNPLNPDQLERVKQPRGESSEPNP